MNNPHYDSLRKRLVLPFALLGYVVSVLLSLSTFGLVAELEDRAIKRALHVELESFLNRKAQNQDALPPSATLLRGHFLPVPDFPHLEPEKPGKERIEHILHDNHDYTVMLTEVDGKPFALIYDRSYVASNLGQLALILLAGTALMTLLSFLIGNHLAGQVVSPISKLLAEITAKATRIDRQEDALLTFSPEEYPRNEIGHLVRALDGFALRLSGFLKRESFFSADVSHELRTPIAVIRGSAEVLVEYPDLPEEIRQRLRTIYRHALRMGQLLEAMLLLSQEGSSENNDPACAIAEVIGDAVADSTSSLLGRPVTISVALHERPILSVERSLAYVVISNILRNACAYTREGVIRVILNSQHLEIIDSGIGIPEDRFPDLFNRYVKSEESAGYGLGLSIVARVSTRLGWKVEIHSRCGEGTSVRILFNEPSAESSA